MPLIVECECGQRYETPEHNAGRRTRCPECGRVLTVPHPAPVEDILYIPELPEPSRISRAASASLWLGALLFFGCLSGVPAILLGCTALGDINRSGDRLRGKRRAIIGIGLGVVGCFFTMLMLISASEPREAALRPHCVNNLKQIGLALHNYHEAYGCFPPAAITDKNGRPLLSWRVALLPFLDDNTRYAHFHLDEPWNSPHNLALLNEAPSVYQCPSDRDRPKGMTNYQVIIGANTVFPPDFRPVTIADVTDGTSNTIAIGESRQYVPWTKPGDLRFEMALPFSGLGSQHSGGFNVSFVDGSVHFLKTIIDPHIFRALLTRNGAEVISTDCY